MKKIPLVILGLSFLQSAFGGINLDIDRAWMRVSDPLIMSSTFNRQFVDLPMTGAVVDQQKNWSSDYWPRYKGGINYRWNASTPRGFNLISPTKSQAQNMSYSQLAALAPSEKWDLFIGRYDYPLKKEIAAYASPSRPTWEGICDGWAGASLNQDEPQPITVANPDGIQIPFGSADIKGLLSWYYSRKYSGGYAMMGRRCNGTLSTVDRCNHDMNAGAFHIVLTNHVGEKGLSFIADIDRNKQVWNHLAYSYSSSTLYSNLHPRSTSASGTVTVARVRTVVKYVFNTSVNTWEPVLGTSSQHFTNRTYEYYLDLNADGRIIGGDWISTQRPDFLWLERKVSNFTGILSRLPEVLPDGVVEGEVKSAELADNIIE